MEKETENTLNSQKNNKTRRGYRSNNRKNVKKVESKNETNSSSSAGNSLVKREEKPLVKTKEKPLAKLKDNKLAKIRKKEEFGFKKENLKIIPLGGIEEIGKNITVFEYGNDIVLVDCGVAFPEDDMLGIDLVIPDFTYLERNKDKIRGLVVTHGHEDHIGSIPYLLKQMNIPIYATKLTIGLISNKLEEHKLLKTAKLNTVKQGQTVVLGKMRVEFIRSCHSIPDAVALAIHTPVGTVVHTGDFKID